MNELKQHGLKWITSMLTMNEAPLWATTLWVGKQGVCCAEKFSIVIFFLYHSKLIASSIFFFLLFFPQ